MSVYYPRCAAAMRFVFDGFGNADSDPKFFAVEPRSATVHMNGYKQADTFEIEINGKDLPISPELIRSAAVQIFMYQSDALVYGLVDGDRAFSDKISDPQNQMIAGLVDDISELHSRDGHFVHMTGRDYTALLTEKKWPSEQTVPLGNPLDVTVQNLVDAAVVRKDKAGNLVSANTLKVELRSTVPAPVVSKVDRLITHKKLTQHIKTPPKVGKGKPKTKAKGIPFKSGQNYWDVIYKLCVDYGFVVFVEGNSVVISDPQVLNEGTQDAALCVAYGRNLSSLSVERKLARKASVPQVISKAYDPRQRKQIVGKWPLATKGKQTGIGTWTENIEEFPAPSPFMEQAEITAFCKARYEALGRHESVVKIQTRALKDTRENSMLSLRPGKPIQIDWDELHIDQLRKLAHGEIVSRLTILGYSSSIAELIANNVDHIRQFTQPYYTKEATFHWDRSSGIDIEVEGMNYISVARDKNAG